MIDHIKLTADWAEVHTNVNTEHSVEQKVICSMAASKFNTDGRVRLIVWLVIDNVVHDDIVHIPIDHGYWPGRPRTWMMPL